MWIETSKIELENAVNLIGKALLNRVDGELGTILMSAKKGEEVMTLKTTNGELTIDATAGAQADYDCEVMVNGKLFADLIRKIPNGEITLQLQEKQLEVIYSDGTVNLPILEKNSDFWFVGEEKHNQIITVNSSLFKKMANRVLPFVATDNARPNLKGVNFRTDSYFKMLIACALDGYRMAKVEMKASMSDKAIIDVIVPTTAINAIAQIVEDSTQIEICLSDTGRTLSLKYANCKIVTRLLNEKFIDYGKIIPKDSSVKCDMPREKTLQCLERAGLFDGQGRTKLTFANGCLEMSIKTLSERGSLTEKIEAKTACYNGVEDLNITFNNKYLVQAFKALTEKEVLFEASKPSDPATIKVDNGDLNTLFLILPIRTLD